MKIKEKLQSGNVHISFEVFPPKTDDKYESVVKAVDEIATVRPSFISVTYGAGGGTSKNTVGDRLPYSKRASRSEPCTSDLRVLDESGGA